MQVHALKIQEIPEISVGTKTQIVVEAQTLFDVSPGGLYYAAVRHGYMRIDV